VSRKKDPIGFDATQRKTKPGPVPREKAEVTTQKLNEAFRRAAEGEKQASKKRGGKKQKREDTQ
jgi:hypothetical protein